MAWSDRPWVLDGAAVRVSMVGFDNGAEVEKYLNGVATAVINADLTGCETDVTVAKVLPENALLAFQGVQKGGAFDISWTLAEGMLLALTNPNGRKNSDVVRRRLGGLDVVGRNRDGWIVDFGATMAEDDASLYELPFEYPMCNFELQSLCVICGFKG